MKFFALLCVIALGVIVAQAQDFSSGELYSSKTTSSSSVVVEEAIVSADSKPSQTGSSRPKKQIVKRTNLRPDHRSKAVFKGLGSIDVSDEEQIAPLMETINQEELIRMLEFSVGSDWDAEYVLPSQDLSLMEAVELSAELNERNIQISREERTTRGYGGKKGPGICFCHGTAHHYPDESSAPNKGGDKDPVTFKGYPYYGIRMFKSKIPHGHNDPDEVKNYSSHNGNPYEFRDCVLSEDEYEWSYSYEQCCTGFCIIDPSGGEGTMVSPIVPNMFQCNSLYDDDEVHPGNKKLAINNKFDCVRACILDGCTCAEINSEIKEREDQGVTECGCEARVTANNQCNCDAEDNIPWSDYENTCTCELLLNDEPSCTCLEGMENRGCTCADAFQWIDEKQNTETDFLNTCNCENMIGVADAQQCGCDNGLEICDGTCCEFYATESVAEDCTDEVHASFIGAQVTSCGECSDDATLQE